MKHRTNTGGVVSLCAGIISNRVRVWHYLPKTWNGEEAAQLYTKVLYPALKRNRGAKRSYTILEDNDPTGYKSTKGIMAKRACKITTVDFPTYSPDLNPCDFALWQEVEDRMGQQRFGWATPPLHPR